MSGIKRNEIKKINQLFEVFPVVLILGVRQCGKTTLTKMVRPEWKYFDLENSKDRDFIQGDFDFFFDEYPKQIIIDEAQELPELFKNLRGVIDRKRSLNNRFLLTGSSSPELVSLASDTLAGRIGIVKLGTLKFNEIKERPLSKFYSIFSDKLSEDSIKQLKTLKIFSEDDILPSFLKGGYPQPILSKKPNIYKMWMQNYFDTYVNRDIRKLFPRLDLIKYERFIHMLSELSGTVINRSQLGRSIDTNEVSIRDYLDIADKTYIWRNIPSFEKSKSKSIIKMPKGILRDSGLCHYLTDILTREQLIRSAHVGQNFEAYIIEEIIKGIHSSKIGRWNYSYYRTKHGAEIDLILEGDFGLLPVEIKFSSSTNPSCLYSLKRFLKEENLPFGIVINNSKEVKMLASNIIQVPAVGL